jgi:hypothetical protein
MDGGQQRQSSMHRAPGVVFMRLRPAKIDQQPFPQILGHMAAVVLDHGRTGGVILPDDLPEVFGVELPGQCGGVCQVTTEHGELPALGLRGGGADREGSLEGEWRWQLCRVHRSRDWRLCERRDFSHKPIALPVQCFDDRWRGRRRRHGFAQPRQTPGEGGLTDKRPGPALLEQFLSGNYTVSVFQEIEQDLKNLRRTRGALSYSPTGISVPAGDSL